MKFLNRGRQNENRHIGSDFNEFLNEEGLLAECQSEAIKRVIVWQINEYMKEKSIKKI